MSEEATQLPSKAVGGDDLVSPTQEILRGVSLLGTKEEMHAAGSIGAIFKGPPQSVALIEAGLTSASKAWAAGAGATVIAAWGSVYKWVGDQPPSVRVASLSAAAFVTAALVLGVAHIFASDVRGRADASVATINGRTAVARSVVAAATTLHEPDAPAMSTWVALPASMTVKHTAGPPSDERNWQAVAFRDVGDSREYLVVKDSRSVIANAGDLDFSIRLPSHTPNSGSGMPAQDHAPQNAG